MISATWAKDEDISRFLRYVFSVISDVWLNILLSQIQSLYSVFMSVCIVLSVCLFVPWNICHDFLMLHMKISWGIRLHMNILHHMMHFHICLLINFLLAVYLIFLLTMAMSEIYQIFPRYYKSRVHVSMLYRVMPV